MWNKCVRLFNTVLKNSLQRLKSLRVKVLHYFENNLYDSHFKKNLLCSTMVICVNDVNIYKNYVILFTTLGLTFAF